MADYLTTDTELTSIANAIRTKGGTAASLTYPTGFVNAIEAIPSGSSISVVELDVTGNGTYNAPSGTAYSPVVVDVPGSTDDSKYIAFISRSTNTPTLPSGLTQIGDYTFYNWQNLALTSLPSGITSIGSNAFYMCSNLELTSLPSGITSLGTQAFYNCKKLKLESLPNGITSIGTSTFNGCELLALTSLPSGITSIGTKAFSGCHNLNITSLPSGVTSIGSNAFAQCISIQSITCNGGITSLSSSAFNGSASYIMQLATVSFPNMEISSLDTAFGSSSASYACQNLETADIGKTKAIAANAFANCYKLQTLVLRKTDAICTLANVSAFLNTPMRGYNSLTGTVYVPSALISSYQTASNWSTLYNNGTLTFAAIEGSQYEL